MIKKELYSYEIKHSKKWDKILEDLKGALNNFKTSEVCCIKIDPEAEGRGAIKVTITVVKEVK